MAQAEVEEIADGSNPEPDAAAVDLGVAAAEALARAETTERELHSFEIEPSQVIVNTFCSCLAGLSSRHWLALQSTAPLRVLHDQHI